ncbi:hypothetical protein OROGR_013375 [Orobanche gracilis]
MFFSNHSEKLPDLLSLDTAVGTEPKFPMDGRFTDARTPRQQRRHRVVSEKARRLQNLLLLDKKMDTASVLEETHKYIRFLEAQVSVLQSMPEEDCDCETRGGGSRSTATESGVDLGRLNRQESLQVMVNSPAAQKLLYSNGCCIYSLEQLALLKKNARFHQTPRDILEKEDVEKIKKFAGGLVGAYAGDVGLWDLASTFIVEWFGIASLTSEVYKHLKPIELKRYNEGIDLILARCEEDCPRTYVVVKNPTKEDGRQRADNCFKEGPNEISQKERIISVGRGAVYAEFYIKSSFHQFKSTTKLDQVIDIVQKGIVSAALEDECTGRRIQVVTASNAHERGGGGGVSSNGLGVIYKELDGG